MLLLFFALALTDAQQAQHDRTELKMYQRIQADQETISDIWQPDARLLADYKKARACYTNFHLYRVRDCDAQRRRVQSDLGNVEVAKAGHIDH
jgi:hypothetical protein